MEKAQLPPWPGRRGFLAKLGALVFGGISAVIPMIAGLAVLCDPLRRKSAEGGFVRVTTLDALPEDGVPRRFPVLAQRTDAWNKYPNVPVGAVFLRRTPKGEVEALNVSCPHAGCAVEFKSAARSYHCPCHDSKFNLDGSLGDLKSPSPRAMDALGVEIRGGTEVWVEFRNFEPGKAQKVARS